MHDPTAHGLGVTARDFGLRGPRGWAFRGIDLDAEPGALIAVEGPSGSGRTCLLLALTGRMRPTAGTARVGEFELPRRMSALRRVTALAHVAGVTDLEPALTVGEHLRERALLQRRFNGSLRGLLRPRAGRRAETRQLIGTALDAAGLDLAALPKGDRTAVRDLERPQELCLSIALALMSRPRLLAVDDTDLKLSDAERAAVWERLRSISASGTTVLAACSQAPEGAVVVSTGSSAKPSAASSPAKPSAAPSTGSSVKPSSESSAGSSAGSPATTADDSPDSGSPAEDGRTADGPTADGPTADGPTADGSTTDGSATDNPAAGGPATDEPRDRTKNPTKNPTKNRTKNEEKADALAEAGRS
ncbi:ATP-binding cassette domain-containing protein [Streptomyces thermoalcalitolerans]|uniref:ABC transporter domain-containing protein n=1 Tax=Streptomyces thermoalcalitolerans TaxID=65605 RepID=A0ABN1NLC1_9ACTN